MFIPPGGSLNDPIVQRLSILNACTNYFPIHRLFLEVLRQVSRSFYLTVRILPSKVRDQIGLAYLLARATDTIADTDMLPVEERLAALAGLRARILGQSADKLDLHRFVPPTTGKASSASESERILLSRIEEVLRVLASFERDDQQRIRAVLSTITSGQELDLERFRGASPSKLIPLETDADLDDYTYRVAGCVGEFWTKMCRAHLFPQARVDDGFLLTAGVRFGKGLQLVNILRDLPRDLGQGRCYLPAAWLAKHGLRPENLLDRTAIERFRPFYDNYLNLAEGYLSDGWEYTNALPPGYWRLRLACAWPILIGVRTIGRLRSANPLDAQQRIKISRGEVRGIILQTLVCAPFNRPWRGLFAWAKTP